MIIKEPILIDIVILSYAKTQSLKQMTEQTVNSLINSEDPKNIRFNVIVIESNHAMKPHQYLHTETLYINKKFGYHRYMNIGIKCSNHSYVCICNNDLFFHANWCSEILKAMASDDTIQSASPSCSIHHPSIGLNLNTGNYEGYEVRREISGWCLFFKRDILKKIGKLDEKFKFWYADNDYANTLKKYGIKHVLVTSSIVDHFESKTLKTFDQQEQIKMTTGERFYYEYKWEGRSYLSYLNRLFKSKREINKVVKKN